MFNVKLRIERRDMSLGGCFFLLMHGRDAVFSAIVPRRLQTVDEGMLDEKGVTGTLRERLAALVASVLGDAAVRDHPAFAQIQLSELGVSSLKMVNLMLAVESEFELEIPQAEITPENFHSILTIEAMLHRLAIGVR